MTRFARLSALLGVFVASGMFASAPLRAESASVVTLCTLEDGALSCFETTADPNLFTTTRIARPSDYLVECAGPDARFATRTCWSPEDGDRLEIALADTPEHVSVFRRGETLVGCAGPDARLATRTCWPIALP